MKDHPASWRMPTDKQMEKLAAEAARREASQAHQQVPEVRSPGVPIQQRRLSEIPRHVLRVSCRRCDRVVEIQTTDAIRLYGPHTIWKDAGRRMLDDGCQQRTGSRDEDGCWPAFD